MQTVFEQEYKGKLKDKRRGENKTKQKNKDIRSRQFKAPLASKAIAYINSAQLSVILT